METLIENITPLVEQYGVIGVFFLSLIEEIAAPVPSSFVLMAAGFFLIPHELPLGEIIIPAILKVILPATAGLTLGSLFVYSVGYLAGKPAIGRWGKWFGITWQQLEAAEARFTSGRADEFVIFGLRAVPVTPNFLISAICGVVRYPIKEFIVLTFLGGMTRALLMGFLGWSVGAAYVEYAAELGKVSNLIAAVSIALVIGGGLVLILRSKLIRKR